MAITAIVSLVKMGLMAELDIAGTGRELVADCARHSGVALNAVGFHTERSFVIMAAAARFSLLHLTHAEMLVAGSRNEQVRMAVLAAVGGNMHRMAEHRTAGTVIDLLYRMALLTVGFHAKSSLAIVAGTA